MITTAKLFQSGNSQAVRLPKAFRMPGEEVFISRNEATGEVILSPKNDDQRQRNLAELFRMIREQPVTEDFIPPRSDEVRPDPFEDWAPEVPPKRSTSTPRAEPKLKTS
jgi:antitoxin VapB